MAKIYVGNLPFSADEAAVRTLFSQHGTVESVALPTDRETGRPRGFGFVEMPQADAARAIQALNGYSMGGRPLRVNEAQDKPRTAVAVVVGCPGSAVVVAAAIAAAVAVAAAVVVAAAGNRRCAFITRTHDKGPVCRALFVCGTRSVSMLASWLSEPILRMGDPLLLQRAAEVARPSARPGCSELLADMDDTMHAANGGGAWLRRRSVCPCASSSSASSRTSAIRMRRPCRGPC